MRKQQSYLRTHWRSIVFVVLATAFVCCLLLYRLGSLVHGLSADENKAANAILGLHGIYHQPLNLPLSIVRSIDFKLFPHHGQTLTRLPNAFFGLLSIVSFAWLLYIWHGRRTALFGTALFTCGAWTLHVSRLASFDVEYLWAIITLLLVHALLQRYQGNRLVIYGSLAIWGLFLYIPGLIWLVLVNGWWQRHEIVDAWDDLGTIWKRIVYVLVGLIWLPLLIWAFVRSPHAIRTWLGLPEHFASPLKLLKHFAGVWVHLFVRGPEYHQLWLGRAPLLDVFTLAACLAGIYFYIRHWRAGRSQLLFALFLVAVILVALGGPVSLSLAVPILYMWAAAGIAYILHEWLRVFPINPIARGLGIGLVTLAVVVSCLYNLRAYFVAWPHDPSTQTTFSVKR